MAGFRRLLTRRRLITFVVALLMSCVAFVFLLRTVELALTFHPVRASNADNPYREEAEDVWFTAADSTRLHGLYFPSKRNPAMRP
ncbi:MAG TPA: hypothetical protein VKB46_06530 [Pyrinomonadaceae bacterium]|nr:hypothetical protein [Pyrinomonadaceae bacterium]